MKYILIINHIQNSFEYLTMILFLLFAFYFFYKSKKLSVISKIKSEKMGILSFGFMLISFLLLYRIAYVHIDETSLTQGPLPKIFLSTLLFLIPIQLYCARRVGLILIKVKTAVTLLTLIFFIKILIDILYQNRIINLESVIHDVTLVAIVSIYLLLLIFLTFNYVLGIVKIHREAKGCGVKGENNIFIFALTLVFGLMTVKLYFLNIPEMIMDMHFMLYSIIYVFVFVRIFLLKDVPQNFLINNDQDEYHKDLLNDSYSENLDIDIRKKSEFDNKADDLQIRLLKYFEEEKPYLRSNLTINEVSLYLYTNKTYLSRVINERLDKNFNQFLNIYRIEEAKRVFHGNNNISMEDLYTQAGFGSMASFCIAFRIYVGDSPSEWCKEQKQRMRNGDLAKAF